MKNFSIDFELWFACGLSTRSIVPKVLSFFSTFIALSFEAECKRNFEPVGTTLRSYVTQIRIVFAIRHYRTRRKRQSLLGSILVLSPEHLSNAELIYLPVPVSWTTFSSVRISRSGSYSRVRFSRSDDGHLKMEFLSEYIFHIFTESITVPNPVNI